MTVTPENALAISSLPSDASIGDHGLAAGSGRRHVVSSQRADESGETVTPTQCRVEGRVEGRVIETAGTIGVERVEGEDALRVTTSGAWVEVAATVSRSDAFALLLAGANALGLVLLDPRDAARRRAENLKRRK